MNKYVLAVAITAGLMQVSAAFAEDDYNNGRDAGQSGYGRPQNDSSADYVQGYNSGQQQRHEEQQRQNGE